MNVYDTTNQAYVFKNIDKGTNNVETYKLMVNDLKKINFDLTSKIPLLKMPIFIITGNEDPLGFLTTEFQKIAPFPKVYRIEKSGHFPMFEQPDMFYKILFTELEQK